jgi:outer membrane protein OmpA-like peptidoglycan-associated protein
MNSLNEKQGKGATRLVGLACATLLLTACAGSPTAPEGSAAARAELTRLQSDPQLAPLAPQAIQEAATAVTAAERPERDEDVAAHRVFMAERKVALAKALASARLAEDQRAQLARQRDEARLNARTQEAMAARDEATMARTETVDAQQQAADLQREIDALRARPTDQGLVLTLGDVLFATGRADLKPGAVGDVDRLVTFLNKYPDRTVIVEGHTDSVGSAQSNLVLSQNRADAVRSYLTRRGVDPGRIETKGMGQSVPVASNESAGGRQQNRRVEIIVSNPPRTGSL